VEDPEEEDVLQGDDKNGDAGEDEEGDEGDDEVYGFGQCPGISGTKTADTSTVMLWRKLCHT
jgi:hypothetical protein